jgi:hypothetical protein
MNIKEQTKNVAAQGRFGDSMLLHVNPAEVKGLAQAMPITINPQTGQPEAFLPFLAPLLGSTLVSGLAASGALGATLAASPALAAGLGAGLATYAQTGGSGSKALLSGLTAGFGTNAANTAAQAANVGQQTTANIAAGMTPDAAATAAQTAAASTPRAATGPLSAIKDTFMSGPQNTFNFDQGATALTQGLMSPSGFAAVGTAGTQGIMESQELFEEMMARNAREAEEERRRIMAENPEMIPIATGGVTSFQEGGATDIMNARRAANNIPFEDDYDYSGGYSGYIDPYNPNVNPNIGSYTGTGYVRKREALPIEQNFMAGFMPERGYFKGLNPSYTEMTDTGETVRVDPLEEYNRTVIAPLTNQSFDPTKTAGYQSFYGQAAKDIIPQVVDPYAPVQFEQPQPLIAPPSIGRPRIPVEQRDTDDTTIADDSRINISEDIPEVDFGLDFSKAFTAIRGEPTPKATAVPSMPDQELMSIYGNEDIPVLDSSEERVESLPGTEIDLTKYSESAQRKARRALEAGMPVFEGSRVGSLIGPSEDRLPPLLVEPPMPGTEIDLSKYPESVQGKVERALAAGMPVFQRDNKIIGPSDERLASLGFAPAETSPKAIPAESLPEVLPTDILNKLEKGPGLASGGDTNIEVDKLPEGLKKMYESGPKGREGVAKIAAKTDKFQEGGATEIMQDPLTVQLLQFLRGEIQDDTIVGRFVDKYGNEVFLQIREQVLQEIVPGAETTGQIVNGNDAGGMADNVYGKIGATQGVAMSQDEYVIPADVMSMLGDGSSDAGAKKLDQMLDRVRMDKTGTTKQAAPINERKVMPA